MRSLTVFFLLALLAFGTPLNAMAAPRGNAAAHRAYDKAKALYVDLRNRDPRIKDLEAWERAASSLRSFVEQSAQKGSNAFIPEALLNLGRLYEATFKERQSRSGLSKSIFYYEHLAKNYPGHQLADDALLSLGDLRRNGLGDETAARAAYFEIIDAYPSGDKVLVAKERVGMLKPKKEPQPARSEAPQAAATPDSESTRDPAAAPPEKANESAAAAPAETAAENPPAAAPAATAGEGSALGGLAALFGREEKSKEIYANRRRIERPLVVIDPGHGGDDLGAVSPHGVYEKDVVLNIAMFLEELLRERLRARIVLTRNEDVFIPLPERTQLANDHEADLFISIHANASPKRNVSGIETYYLENTNDKASLKLAERENQSLLMTPGGKDLGYILSDLIQNAKLDESISLAHHIQDALTGRLSRYYRGVNDLGVKKAPFYVLVGAHMPCVLTEVAFIDHPVEGERLVDRRYQKLVAEALYQGVRSYFGR